MTIEDFVEKAIQGGWDSKNEWGSSPHDIPIERILLDPLAWQSVGKVKGWECRECGGAGQFVIGENRVSHDMALDAGEPAMEGMFHSYEYAPCESCWVPQWLESMHRMIDALAEGGTIESFLETLK